MKATTFLALLVLGILVAPCAPDAQQATKVPRIGWLHPGLSRPAPHPSLEDFRQGLREIGYVEGQNLVIEYRSAEGRAEQLPDLVQELVRLQVDVIVAGGAAAVRAAQHATRTTLIVMAGIADPVAQGFVASLAAPGGNTTGLSLLNTDLPGKRLEILKATVPQSMRVAVLVNPDNPIAQELLHNLTVAAQELRVHLHVVELHHPDEVDSAFATMTRMGARGQARQGPDHPPRHAGPQPNHGLQATPNSLVSLL